MHLLLIEDDEILARGIAAALAQSDYSVDIAGTAQRARERASEAPFSAGILDLGLPDGDGLDLLREMRSRGLSFPILVLSARDGLNDRVVGLNAGADDYLVKPFAVAELEARLRALLRRAEERPGTTRIGRVRFEAAARQAYVGDKRIDLTSREATILERLLATPRRVVAKHALFDAVFSLDTEAAPNALEVQVSRLRQKLKGAGVHIRSIRGLGYRIEETCADVRTST